MDLLLNTIFGLFNFLGNLVFSPFSRIPLIGLLIASLIAGVVLIIIYGKVSNQKALKKVKQNLYCYLLESVIFRHNVKIALAAQWRMLLQAFKYTSLAIPPLLILAIPCILLLAQMNRYFGISVSHAYKPLIVSAAISDSADLLSLTLTSDRHNIDISPPVRDLKDSKAYWKIVMHDNSISDLKLILKSGQEKKEVLLLGESDGSIYTKFVKPGLKSLLYPNPLSANWLKEISISFAPAYFNILGVNLHWIIIFFLFSFASGIVASRYMRIEI